MKILLTIILFFYSPFCYADISTGLVGWWKFDDGSGSSAVDSSGYGNTGTLHNGPAWVAGKLGDALSFNGSTQYVSIAALNQTSNTVTFTAWVNQVSAVAWAGIIFSRNSSAPIGMNEYASGNIGYTWNYNNPSTYDWNTGLSIPNNQWALVVIAIGSTQTVAYLCSNGSCSSATLSITSQSQTFNGELDIGQDSYNTSRFFNGLIDDPRVYTRTLSAADVTQLYNAQSRIFLNKAKLNKFTS